MFVLAIILAVLALVPLLIRKVRIDGQETKIWKAGVTLLTFSLIFLFLASLTNVPANSAGVKRFGGSVSSDTLDGGWHMKAPWESVNDIDGTERTERYHGDSCISVALGDRSQTCMSVSVRWKINIDKANEIYQSYRNQDDPVEAFRNAVVSPQIIAASVDAAQDYNPVAQLKAQDADNLNADFKFEIDYLALSKVIQDRVVEQTGGRADILNVSVTNLPLSEQSQRRVDNIVAAIGDTILAKQLVQTNKQKAEANRVLAESINKNPAVNTANCQQLIADSPAGTFPAGFQCIAGSGGSVVIPSK